MSETYTGTVAEASFVRAGDALLCQTCSDDQGDPTGDYCCECCNERDRRPGTYLTVRLDQEDARVGVGRVTVAYAAAEPVPVKPSREDVAREIALGDDPTCPWPDGFTRMEEARAYRQADAVLALLPGRTEAEVKAEALEVMAKWFQIASRLGTGEPDALAAQACADAAARLRGESDG